MYKYMCSEQYLQFTQYMYMYMHVVHLLYCKRRHYMCVYKSTCVGTSKLLLSGKSVEAFSALSDTSDLIV